MAKKRRARSSRFADDAALQALVRYEPEESGLRALAQQARADYGTTIRQAQTTGDLTIQAAREAIPAVSRIYDSAGLDQARTASLVSPELAALTGPGAAILQRGGALEVAQQLGNLRSARAGALEDLNTRMVAARQGQQYGVIQARQKYQSDIAKILDQSQSLARQKGAFTASTINSLNQAALERSLSRRNALTQSRTTRRGQDKSAAQQERNSLRSSGIDPDTGKPIPGGKLDPKVAAAIKPQTPGAHGKVSDQVTQMRSFIRQNKSEGRRALAQDMLNGVSPQTYKKGTIDPNTGKPLANDVHDPGVPKAPSALALSVALDMEFLGGVSNGTARRLHERGYSVKQLGLRPAPPRKKALVPRLKNPFATPIRS